MRKVVASLVLVVGVLIAIKLLAGIVAAVFWSILAVAVVVAILWAIKTIFW